MIKKILYFKSRSIKILLKKHEKCDCDVKIVKNFRFSGVLLFFIRRGHCGME